MRVHTVGWRPVRGCSSASSVCSRSRASSAASLPWCWTQAACLISLHPPMRLPAATPRQAMWRLLVRGGWSTPSRAFPTSAERAAAPGSAGIRDRRGLLPRALRLGGVDAFTGACAPGGLGRRWARSSARSPAGRSTAAGCASAPGRCPQTCGVCGCPGPVSGRPYLGVIGRVPARTLAAELEVQPMVVAPPRAGKSSGFVVPWLLDHDGPALVLSTKRDIYDATAPYRRSLGRVWVYDPFGDGERGLHAAVPARSWPGAIRAGEALASAAHPDSSNAANEFWDKEAASMLAPLLHAAAISGESMSELVRWLDARDFTRRDRLPEGSGRLGGGGPARGRQPPRRAQPRDDGDERLESAARLPLPAGRSVRRRRSHPRAVPRRAGEHDLCRRGRARPGRAAAGDPRSRRRDVRGGDRQGAHETARWTRGCSS